MYRSAVVEQLEDVLATRDYPVLMEVTRRIDRGEHAPRAAAIAEALGMSGAEVSLAGQALKRRGLSSTITSW
jgi:hypothetical protein